MTIALKRVYEPAARADGCRILVERLWPRGVSKASARIDLWAKEAAPSADLRRWFNHQPQRWEEFKRRYFSELDNRPTELAPIRERLRVGRVTFVFASRETRFNNAVALKEFLERPSAAGSRLLRTGGAAGAGRSKRRPRPPHRRKR